MELWSFWIVSSCFILYLHFLAHDVFVFLIGLSMIGGDNMMYIYIYIYIFLVSHCLLIYIYEDIHDICLYFVVCEIKKLFLFCLYFPHMRLCVC